MYNVLIRPLIEEDAVTSYRWRNDSDIWKFTGQRPDIEISQGIEFDWIRRVLNEYDSHRFAILADDIYVGNIQITNVVAEEGEYHIFIGEKDYWGKGIATLATQQLLRYAKKRLNLKRVYLVVNPLNTPAIRVYEKCGFIRVSDEIKMVFDLSQNLKPTVSVFMMTYNHEAYIRQAVESILCQKTNFDFDIVIGEDFSTDNTRSIVMSIADQYPGKFKLLLHEKNIGAMDNQMAVLSACTGQYTAFCEGDDYWTDPYKLQKQVDFFDQNPDYGIVHSGVQVVDSENKVIIVSDSIKPSSDVFYDLLLGSAFIVTCSVCAKSNLIHEAVKHANEKNLKCVFDYWLWLHIAMRSKIHYDPSVTSAYRSHSGGVTQSNRKFFYSVVPLAVLDVISDKFKYYPEIKFLYRWQMFIAFCRAITSRSITIKDRIHYSVFLIKHPVSFFAFIPALYKKISNKLNKLK